MGNETTTSQHNEREGIIGAVKTYLGFFALIVLVVETVFGTVALKGTGSLQMLALISMLAVIALLILVVSFFAYRKPEALLRGIGSPGQGETAVDAFAGLIAGYWWEWIRPDDASALSLVEIHPDSATGTVKLKGTAFRSDGSTTALWESVASCLNGNERKVFYYWKGWHPLHPEEPYEGFGEISFHRTDDTIDSGVGFFSDTKLTDLKSTRKKSIDMRRCDHQEVLVMRSGDNKAIAELIRRKL